MKTLNKYLEGKDVFTTVKESGGFTFIQDNDIPAMNGLLALQYGNKSIFAPIENVSFPILCDMLALEVRSKWEGYVKAELILANLNVRRELSETITDNEERTNEKNDVAKISAFNSNDLIDDTGNNSTGGDTLQGERERIVVDENIDPAKAYNMLDATAKNGIINRVIGDTAEFFTLSIY